MRLEVKSAANFLTNLLRVKSGNNQNLYLQHLPQLETFCAKLEDMLCVHYQQHWFPEKPFKGSGYRCIRINHKMDPIILKAGAECGFDEEVLRKLFPDELTLWIDPKEVSYRIGENGSICVLFDGGAKASHVDRTPPRTVTITVNHRRNDNSPTSSVENTPPSPNVMYDRSAASCKKSIRASGSWEHFVMDPRNMNLEQFTPYVSS